MVTNNTGPLDGDVTVPLDGTPFALLHRPHATGPDRLELLLGDVTTVERLAALPLDGDAPDPGAAAAGHELLALLPYRQIAERGYTCTDDGAPLAVLKVREQHSLPTGRFLTELSGAPLALRDEAFDIPDDEYAQIVRKVIDEEIGQGAGANFVIKRAFTATIDGYTPAAALTFFSRLLAREAGAYWTFLVHTGERTFVGASPERHISLESGTVTMNPISGTYRYPGTGPTVDGALGLLADRKEREELQMVVDEELKMMARICDPGLRVEGPFLKEMARLAHTEYFITGESRLDVREILRETMFAPTVTGSPVESACEVLHRYEPRGRSYYSGALALVGRDGAGRRAMDSAILIRTAEIDTDGRLEIGVGATLVRHSDPRSEVAETHAKAAGLLSVLREHPAGTAAPAPAPAAASSEAPRRLGEHPEVLKGLASYNERLARFWLDPMPPGAYEAPELAGLRAAVVDHEDTFTAMLAHQLRSLGLSVTVHAWREASAAALAQADLVVLGPGPGDPRRTEDPKIAAADRLAGRLLADGTPCVAVCLGHQVVASLLGIELVRKETPNQGLQQEIDFFGRRARTGFYNTFAGRSDTDRLTTPAGPFPAGAVEVSRDPHTGEVHGLRGPGFATAQFHPESLLTEDGPALLHQLVTAALATSTTSSGSNR
ncbi:anthranilate synthase family protein [Streptomyces sp. NBC_01264]|uniref:anthranilate synthase family protein n=1 Tax=Streptomyces sp. NBC_01264 TaxID=2903804 RepID=UPI00225215C4|nr:chorismate-binding protein [Streptomyces sp. NBC_01264]MCX4783055.1 chorismate-binding protein [Streptomyces sp. NBC_01264]